ncbi:MAG: hypothetical protein AB7R69_02910 [Candidatus Babeliales bacterium]
MNKSTFNILVALQLIRRDLLVIIKNRLFDDLIDTTLVTFLFNFIFGYLSPLMGIDKNLIAATFLGSFTGSIVFICFSRALNDLADLEMNKFIDYRRTLPFSSRWFLTTQVISYALHCLITTLPVLIIGILLLKNRLDFSHANWALFSILYINVIMLIASFFSCLVFTSSFAWFKFNVWQRILSPLLLLGCSFFSWKKAYLFSPIFAQSLLINPMTYCIEGLRSGLFGSILFLPVSLCFPVVALVCGILFGTLLTLILKNLDWVKES